MNKESSNFRFKDFGKTKLGPRRQLAEEESFFYYSYIACLSVVLSSVEIWTGAWGRWVLLNFFTCIFLVEILLRLPSSNKPSNAFSKSGLVTFFPTMLLVVLVDYLRRSLYVYSVLVEQSVLEQPAELTAPFYVLDTVQLSINSYLIILASFFLAVHYYTKDRSAVQRLLFALFLSVFVLSFGGA